jgi:DNA-binding transcriptional ArsR family regulator
MRNRSVTYRASGSAPSSRAQHTEAVFQALADPTRRAVLDLLRRGPQAAGQIAGFFPVSRPAISKHLRQLRRARLVVEHRRGRHRLYQLNPDPLRNVHRWLEAYRQFWTASLNNLKEFVEVEHAKETGKLK